MLALPKEFAFIAEPFLDAGIDEDHFQDLVLAYYSARKVSPKKNRYTEIRSHVQMMLKEHNRADNILYNPHRNISLNQCFGDSNAPAADWLNLTDWEEWQ